MTCNSARPETILKMNKTPMTKEAAARIQSSTAKTHGHVAKSDFAARALAAAARNIAPVKPGK